MSRAIIARDALLLALAACGGALDAVSYLRLHAFTANMTGNSIFLGLAIGGRHLADTAHSAVAIGAFAAGAWIGAGSGREATDEDPWPAALLRPFALEVALIVAFALLWKALPSGEERTLVSLGLGAGAMGIQSGITHDIHHGSASTTYMTGTIARTMEYAVDALKFGFRGGIMLNGLAWILYLCSAILVGALDVERSDVGPAVWAAALVVFAVAVAGRPIVTRLHGTFR